jgi:hypothetical protein
MNSHPLPGWDRLRHGGLLLDAPRLQVVARLAPTALAGYLAEELRRQAAALLASDADASSFVVFILERICGFAPGNGTWLRGPALGAEWRRRTPTGETAKPRHLWRGPNGATLPIFLDGEKHVGVGRGRRTASQVVQWLRAGSERLALLTNGRQWRLIFAGLDFDAFCEWDADLWFEEGQLSPQVQALRTLLSPQAFTPAAEGQAAPLLAAVLDSRKGQAELSGALGERVREAVELLVQGHGEALREHCTGVDPAEIYRAAVRVVMRIVVVLFAESRDLMPRDNALYHGAYGISGLLEELEKAAARGGNRLARSHSAWPRLLALFRLVHQGSHHPALPVPGYGGELFAPVAESDLDGLSRALRVFETAAFDTSRAVFSDREVHRLLERVSRTRVRLRQGRQSTWVTGPVDFSDLSSEYIGILYEGLLDFELRTAPAGDPVIFLAVGNQPALPLSRLEGMDDKALAALLEKMKDTSKKGDDEGSDGEGADEDAEEAEDGDESAEGEEDAEGLVEAAADANVDETGDHRHITRTRAESWARRAVEAGKLTPKPRGSLTTDKRRAYDEAVSRKARQLVIRVVLPGEWFLVRWGGTRKGSGTFYTRPGLAVPTVQRTLRPLAYAAPTKPDGTPDIDAPAHMWTPHLPEEILALKTCDPACGSGTFPVASLRYLTDALYAAVHHHGRVADRGDRSVVSLLGPRPAGADDVAALGQELVPCRPDDPSFEQRLKAVLKRHVVERCIYGVDLDPLAVELCRLSLWIETMDRSLPFSFLDHKVKCGNGLVGAWFDQFLHYPVMAWKNRDGGDKGHTNGVHFPKEARGKVLREFASGVLKRDLADFLSGPTLFDPRDRAREAVSVHSGALALMARLHDLPVQDAAERARIYREELLAAPAWQELKAALDLWCACWFWPAEAVAHAPLPSTLAAPSAETRAEAARIAARLRFFHWELEFPDVFRTAGSGFDAIVGNPPWENLQPNPEEFFSNFDPLFRTYGRLVKNERLKHMFTSDIKVEQGWLDYCADFNSMSNWVTYVGKCFGDPASSETNGDRFSIAKGNSNVRLHERWGAIRATGNGYADTSHPFVYQTGRIFTYRLFLEQSHALLRAGGRMGQIVPSGIYSDAWSQPLRALFLDHCQWEWLFGFENRDGVFEIDSRFKFNPIIITKGGRTASIRTAFMRRKLEDWERAEDMATTYSREQVDQFSPRTQAVLEIQSRRDLEILEKIYAKSVLLGDDSPDGWGIKYKIEFMMNTDAHLFPPRTKWEEQGYRPDEYSRWLKGDWRPLAELWEQLGVDATRVTPNDVELEDWLFDTTASPERRTSEARFVRGHLLKPGDVSRTAARLRCAQPPYHRLPIQRADIPPGIILSREVDAWIREDRVDDTALPVYQGKMIWQFDPAFAGFGIESASKWSELPWTGKLLQPRYLMSAEVERMGPVVGRILMRDVSSPTNQRTLIATFAPSWPAGHKTPVLGMPRATLEDNLVLLTQLNSLTLDYFLRLRFAISGGGGSLVFATLGELALWERGSLPVEARHWMARTALALTGVEALLGPAHQKMQEVGQARQRCAALTEHERLRLRCMLDALNAFAFGITSEELRWILRDCDYPVVKSTDRKFTRELFGKGFWRIDKDRDPELRHTVLTIVAFHDLEAKIGEHGGSCDAGVLAFLAQDEGEGWSLPETLRLADYGLGHDERAQRPQAVGGVIGPRFYDWQLMGDYSSQSVEVTTHARHVAARQGLKPQGIATASNIAEATPSRDGQQDLFGVPTGPSGGRRP